MDVLKILQYFCSLISWVIYHRISAIQLVLRIICDRWQASAQNLLRGQCPDRCAQSCTTDIKYSSEVSGQELTEYDSACAKRTPSATDGNVAYTSTWLEPTRAGEKSAFFSAVLKQTRLIDYVVVCVILRALFIAIPPVPLHLFQFIRTLKPVHNISARNVILADVLFISFRDNPICR